MAKVGIENIKEIQVAFGEAAIVGVKTFKDGLQLGDFEQVFALLVNNPQYKAQLKAAWENYNQVPDELKDIDLFEGVELVQVAVKYGSKIADAVRA